MSDQPEVTAEDAVQIAQRALSKVNGLERENDALDDRVDELEEEVTTLRLRLSEQDDDRNYHELTLNEKIGMVREHAFERATSGHGRAKLDYDDIMWEVFDGNPGERHCYKLMYRAAGVTSDGERIQDVPGFDVRDPDGENRHLAVDAKAAKQSVAFCSENKATSEEGV